MQNDEIKSSLMTDLEVLDPLPEGREGIQDVALDVVSGLGMLEEGMLEELLGSRPLAGLFHQAETDQLLERLHKHVVVCWSIKQLTVAIPARRGLHTRFI